MDYKEKVIALLNSKELTSEQKEQLEQIFPELKETDTKRISREITEFLVDFNNGEYEEPSEYTIDCWLAWLEKQDAPKTVNSILDERIDASFAKMMVKNEQEIALADKVKPNFKVGDWIVDKSFSGVYQIKEFTEDEKVWFENGQGTFVEFLKGYRLWTIQDAKPGDILHSTGWGSDCIFIFDGLDYWRFSEPNGERAVATGYCCITISANSIEFGTQGPDCVEVNNVKPATKIQRDLLFRNIRENGYEWDSDKLELRKIEEEPENYKKQVMDEMVDCVKDYIKQKSVEWSDTDEAIFNGIIEAAEHHHCLTSYDINWLKSVKPQFQMKLSEDSANEDLDEEIKKMQRRYKTVDEYEGYPATIYAPQIEYIAKHFVNWQKQQMIKESECKKSI